MTGLYPQLCIKQKNHNREVETSDRSTSDRSTSNQLLRDNLDVGTLRPNLWCLFAVPPEGERIIAGWKIGNFHKIHDLEVHNLSTNLHIARIVSTARLVATGTAIGCTVAPQARNGRLKLRCIATIITTEAATCGTTARWDWHLGPLCPTRVCPCRGPVGADFSTVRWTASKLNPGGVTFKGQMMTLKTLL